MSTQSGGGRFLRNDSYVIVQNLHEPAAYGETGSRAVPEAQLAVAEQCHERRMAREDANLSIESRRHNGVRLALEEHSFRRDHRDLEHYALASRCAASTTPSMPPCMKNACSGYWSNSPATRRSNEEIVSSSFTYCPLMPVNCSATANGCDMKRWILRARPTTSLSSSDNSSMPRIAMMSCSSLYRWRMRWTSIATL